MQTISPEVISTIRSAARVLVREHGYMERTLAGTDLSPSAVHTIIELGETGSLTSKELADRLNLEKSTISRLVQALEKRGEITSERQETDGRSFRITLTDQGRRTLAVLAAYGENKVSGALPHLGGQSTPDDVARALDAFATALKVSRTGKRAQESTSAAAPVIVEGYQTGMIGDISGLHGRTHGSIVGFGPAFESVVSAAMAEFMPRISKPVNNSWSVVENGRVVASITIDGEDLGNNIAHLRWFILEEHLRGLGLGRKLLDKAIEHCDRHGFDEIHLWTLKGLDAARALYERNGFKLVDEYRGDQWGKMVMEQKFLRRRAAG
ncbi:bifunctional helix-turn-helix transcriptional regulator/GNAT family N-acetyltransferase [Roseibium aggregatum]|uniref:Bifunctional helix-turn-helix transcriptional regulator/GNAT family N-acetyltransferase n=1 Tax=Roseibium aggregatum TaxID=187304 RepID=A0A926S788_9HYPH|nr:bifunctional helix-turn-helix transcriptional regulator/GNAT family N-acetyltransferase [Roseibium aggregatum]MBD1549383.1 bifunctional helix-turn-helix transcriptional regulator/GNAT family N-acetyltransferase [Roseibium aggregatum]